MVEGIKMKLVTVAIVDVLSEDNQHQMDLDNFSPRLLAVSLLGLTSVLLLLMCRSVAVFLMCRSVLAFLMGISFFIKSENLNSMKICNHGILGLCIKEKIQWTLFSRPKGKEIV